MAINVGTAIAYLTLDRSSFKNSLASAGADLRNFASSGDIKSLGSAMSSVGSTMTKAVTLPLAGIGTVAAKTSMDFDAQMSKVKAISGATGGDFNKLREQAIKLGADTSFSASEAAGGMENLASAGFKTNEIMDAMPGMLNLAAAGDVSIASASDIASSSLRGFGMEASKTTHVADVLAKVAGDTNAGITDTGEAMKYIAPVAHSLGISFEDTSAAIGLLSNAGIKGSQAGTTLRSALTSLASPTKAASKTMKSLGMNFFDAHGKMLPLGQVIQQLQDKTKGLTQQQKASVMQTLFGKEAMSGMLTLVDQGAGKFNQLSNGLKNCDGASKEMADTMQDNLKGSIEAMKGSLETAAIRIGDVLAPGIKKCANFISNLTNAFSSLPKPIQTIIVYAGLLLASVGPVMLIFSKTIGMFAPAIGLITKLGSGISKLSKTFATLKTGASIFKLLPGLISPPVLIVVGVIAGLALVVYEVIKHWNTFKKYVSAFGTFIKNVFKSIWDFIDKVVKGWGLIFTGFSKLLKLSVEGWKIIFTGFGKFLSTVVNGWKYIFSSLGGAFKSIGKFIFEGLYNGISSMASKITNKVKSIANSIKNTFKSALGIHSPSTIFDGYGINTWQGYINGSDKMKSPIKQRLLNFANGIKNLGNVKPQFSGLDSIALSGAYGNSGGLSKIGNLNSGKVLNFDPKITLNVTVADTGNKGTAKLTEEVKSMTKNSLKNGLVNSFMNDVIRG